MKQKLRLFVIHQTAINLQQINNLNPGTKWYPALDESNRMKLAYFTIHQGKNPPPQNGCRPKSDLFSNSTVSHPSLSQFNWTFDKTNRPPLHWIMVLPGHCFMVYVWSKHKYSLYFCLCLINIIYTTWQKIK